MAEGLENRDGPRRDEIVEKLRKLAEVSKELEQNVRMQAAAVNLVQAGELRRRVDELTRLQEVLVQAIVDRHPDPSLRERFRSLSQRIDDFRPEIRACQDPDKLQELKAQIDGAVEEWVFLFQHIVSTMAGVTPPPGPVAGPRPA